MNDTIKANIYRLIDSGCDANIELARECSKAMGDDAFTQEVEERIYQVVLAEFMRVTEPNPQPFTITLQNIGDELTRAINDVAARFPPGENNTSDLKRRFLDASSNGNGFFPAAW